MNNLPKKFHINNLKENKLEEIVKILINGGVLIYPTDTVAGIGARADCKQCVQRIQEIKGRDSIKPFSVAFASKKQMEEYVILNKTAKYLVEKYLPGDLTLIVKLQKSSPPLFMNGDFKTIGVRIIKNKILNQIITKLEVPLITTSANISGNPPAKSVEEIDPFLLDKTDAILAWNGQLNGEPSTVLDVCNGIKVLREGRISKLLNQKFMD